MARKHATNAKSTLQKRQIQRTSRVKPRGAVDVARSPVANMPANALIDNVAQAESTSLPTTVQPKLTVGAVGDPYEQEADRVARQVVNQLNSPQAVQKSEREDAIVQRQIEIGQQTNATMQADMGLEGGAVSGEVESKINSAKSGGQSLSAKTQADMGGAMGADFSKVKVHTDQTADQLNRSMQSRAFTTGPHVFFKKNEFNPSNSSGQELLAHELTHTVQQGASPQVQQQALPQQQAEPNNTGMPLQLKAGVESLSGMSMGDVKVHYNSPEPVKIGALAYTRGTDIHLAPKQEQHLAHEAWHVVQQKQGRVPVTTQFKKLAGNDSSALEHEADVMGTKAAAFTGTQPVGMVQQTSLVQRQVVQARLPKMTDQEILDQKPVAQELMLHAIRAMEDEELQSMMGNIFADEIAPMYEFDLVEGKEAIIDSIKNPRHDNVLLDAYHFINNDLGDEKKYKDYEGPETISLGETKKIAIAQQLPGIITALQNLNTNADLKEQVFGPDYNQGRVNTVLTNTIAGLNKHAQQGNNAEPVRAYGDPEHMAWVGIAGQAQYNTEQIRLGPKRIEQLVSGAPEGKGTLVHEYTHARAKTKDIAYKDGTAKLEPKDRVNNADTYKQAFLTQIGQGKANYLYDAEVVSGAKSSSEAVDEKTMVRLRKNLFLKIKNKLGDAKFLCTNAFGFAKQYLNEPDTMHGDDKQMAVTMVRTVTLPHAITVTEENRAIALAMVEDRRRYFGNALKNLKEDIKSKTIDELNRYLSDDLEDVEVLADFTKDALNLSQHQAKDLFAQITDLRNNL